MGIKSETDCGRIEAEAGGNSGTMNGSVKPRIGIDDETPFVALVHDPAAGKILILVIDDTRRQSQFGEPARAEPPPAFPDLEMATGMTKAVAVWLRLTERCCITNEYGSATSTSQQPEDADVRNLLAQEG